MPAPIDLSNFRVVKTGNTDVERDYINAILHAIVARTDALQAEIDEFNSNGGTGTTGSVLTAVPEPQNPLSRNVIGESGVVSIFDSGPQSTFEIGIEPAGIGATKLDVTGTPSATTVIQDDGTTLTYVEMSGLPTIPDQTFLGNDSGAPAVAYDLDMTEATAMLNLFTASLQGLVPPPITIAPPGSPSTYLKDDGTWDIVFPVMDGSTVGQFLTNDGTVPNWSDLPAFPVGANPTAEVGLTPVNGIATTFMRSDAAPPIDEGIAPTWTGVHTFTPQIVTSGGVDSGSDILNTGAFYWGGSYIAGGGRGFFLRN